MNGKVALAKVTFTGHRNCFVGITKSLARLISASTSVADVIAFELLFDKTRTPIYVSWSGDIVSSNCEVITINSLYAEKLGVYHGQEVIVRPLPPAITPCRRITVEPVSVDDWEILEANAEEIEATLLDQIRIVQAGQVIPIWVNDVIVVFVLISCVQPNVRPIKLETLTEVLISPPPYRQEGKGLSGRHSPHYADPPPLFDDIIRSAASAPQPRPAPPTRTASRVKANGQYRAVSVNERTLDRGLTQLLDGVGSLESLPSLPYDSDDDLDDENLDDDFLATTKRHHPLIEKLSEKLSPDPLLTNLFTAVSRDLSRNIDPVSAATAAAAAASASGNAIYSRIVHICSSVLYRRSETLENNKGVTNQKEGVVSVMNTFPHIAEAQPNDAYDERSSSVFGKVLDALSFVAPSVIGSLPGTTNVETLEAVAGPGSLFSTNSSLSSFKKFNAEILRSSFDALLRIQPMDDGTLLSRQRSPDLATRFSRHASLEGRFASTSVNDAKRASTDADSVLSSVSKFLFCGLKLIWRQPNTVHVHRDSLPSHLPAKTRSFIAEMSLILSPQQNREDSREKLVTKLRATNKADLLGSPTASEKGDGTVEEALYSGLVFTHFVRVLIDENQEDSAGDFGNGGNASSSNNGTRDVLRTDEQESGAIFPLSGHVMVPDLFRRHRRCAATEKVLVSSTQQVPITPGKILIRPSKPLVDDVKDDEVVCRFRQWVSSISSEIFPFLLCNPTAVQLSLTADICLECFVEFEGVSESPDHKKKIKGGYCLIPPSQLTHLQVEFVRHSAPSDWKPRSPEENLLLHRPTAEDSSQISFAPKNPGCLVWKRNAWTALGYQNSFQDAILHIVSSLAVDPLSRHLNKLSSARARGCLLICGRRGVGRTSFARSTVAQLTSPPYLARVTWLDCVPLRGRKVDAVKKEIEERLEEALFHAPSILVLDDLDVLVPSQVPETDSMQEVSYHGRLAEAVFRILSAALNRSESLAVLATAISEHTLHGTLTDSRGHHFFGRVLQLEPPTLLHRGTLLRTLLRKNGSVLPETAENLSLDDVVRRTEGYVARDLERIIERAIHARRMRGGGGAATEALKPQDFEAALDGFTPSALKGVVLHTPAPVNWANVGGLRKVKKKLSELLEWPTKYPRLLSKCPIQLKTGVLLYGPPGTGKTYVAAAAANECGLRFISVKGPELLSKYVGESERAVRDLFDRARAARPCLLFFDEFESLAPRRGRDSTGVADRVVNQLLTQLDGVEARDAVHVLAATSRPDLVDPALLRPGRLGQTLFCPLPNEAERLEILEIFSRRMNVALDDDINLSWVATFCAGFSGADLKGLLHNARLAAFDDVRDAEVVGVGGAVLRVGRRHLDRALIQTKPSVVGKDIEKYEEIYEEFATGKTKSRGAAAGYDGNVEEVFDRRQRQTLA